MDGSAHEKHRSVLEQLAAGGHLAAVAAAAERHGIVASHSPRVLWSRLRADEQPLVDLVVALGPRPRDALRVGVSPRGPDAGLPRPEHVPGLGWLGAAPVTTDPVVAAADDLGEPEATITLIRYHPGKRATVRVAEQPGHGGVAHFVKVRADERGRAKHLLAEQLHVAATDGRLGFHVPRPARYDTHRHASWHQELPGAAATTALQGPAGPALAHRLGTALASLTDSGLDPPQRLAERDLQLRVERAVTELANLVPGIADRAGRLLERLRSDGQPAAPGAAQPVHGAPYPSQWLVAESGTDNHSTLGLLDFDRCSLGDPEHDVGCFLAQVDAASPDRFDIAGLNAAFLAGYQDSHGPLDAERLARYRRLRRLGKALRSARSLRPDGDRRAERALAAAENADG